MVSILKIAIFRKLKLYHVYILNLGKLYCEAETQFFTSKLIIMVTPLYDVGLNFFTGALPSEIGLARNLRVLDVRKSYNI